MSSLKVTLCSGVAAAVAALVPAVLVPMAYAPEARASGDGGSVSVTPSRPAPGAEITLKVTGCAGRTATATSDAFVADARLSGSGGSLVGDTRVRSSVAAGAYDVRITCVDFTVKGRISVVVPSPAEPSRPRESSDSPVRDAPTVAASPVAPVRAGGGGTAPLAAVEEARVDGPGAVQAVIGLVLAGVAAAAVVFRGVRRRRRTD
ncbi:MULTISPECIES: hypothetical protein [unclassified Streptomyces]|uniref:hypothetical protein n=1 Tax=unclassified Streptomyces TaxID=2593676 RepID=UPI000708F382|nr:MULTISPECIES: hypothetical protein [unclassified Streptomyces]KRD24341.1 hypothetical protein ASE41_00650 [Streptomyces sp. Root264]